MANNKFNIISCTDWRIWSSLKWRNLMYEIMNIQSKLIDLSISTEKKSI